MPDLGRRVLRSGKEFSYFDLAVGAPLEPAEFFDLEECLRERVQLQHTSGTWDEPAELTRASTPIVDGNPPLAAASPASPSRSPIGALKAGSKRRRLEKRQLLGEPGVKNIAAHHRKAALQNAIKVELDASNLDHAKPAWTGKRTAEQEQSHETGMGGRPYTRAEIEALTGASNLLYINWLGRLSIPIVDSQGRIIAVLGGMPADVVGWKAVTDRAAELLETKATSGSFSVEKLYHRRAHEPYPSISRGLSHGGGQLEPGELQNNVANTRLTDECLRDSSFQRLAGFANCLFRVFAPILFLFYQRQMALIAAWRPTLRWNFARSVFAACTFNFGPHAITVPHLDFGNLAWGWCAITALGSFDPDLGGHLILWDLKLVIRFPPGSTILIPSAIIRHSNVPVAVHERRYSFTQYTAGGLFRWIRNGFRTEEAFESDATQAEKAAREAESETRWADGVGMFSTVESLQT